MSIVVTSNFETKPEATPKEQAVGAEESKEATPAAEVTPAEKIEASGASNEEELETEEGEKPIDPASETKPKAKSGYKKRIDKLSKRLAEADRQIAYLRGNADAKTVPVGQGLEQKVEASIAAGEPDPNNFEGSHAEYLKALTKWQIAEDKRLDSQKAKETNQKTELELKVKKFGESITAFQKATPDYDDVIEAAEDVTMNDDLKAALLESEDAGRLCYELCKNKEEYKKIAALSGYPLVKALARFEAKIEPGPQAPATSEKKTSNAPAPINPVGNKGTGAGKKSITDPNLSQREFEALVHEQMKARGSAWG